MTGGAECFVTGDLECFVDTDFLVVLSACHCSNLPLCVPLHSCKWGNVVPLSISLQFVWHNYCMGDHCYLEWCFGFHSGCRCRGNWPIFPCFEQVLGG